MHKLNKKEDDHSHDYIYVFAQSKDITCYRSHKLTLVKPQKQSIAVNDILLAQTLVYTAPLSRSIRPGFATISELLSDRCMKIGVCLCKGIVVVGGQVPSDPHPVVVQDPRGFQVNLLHLLVMRNLAFHFETRGEGCEYLEGIVSTWTTKQCLAHCTSWIRYVASDIHLTTLKGPDHGQCSFLGLPLGTAGECNHTKSPCLYGWPWIFFYRILSICPAFGPVHAGRRTLAFSLSLPHVQPVRLPHH